MKKLLFILFVFGCQAVFSQSSQSSLKINCKDEPWMNRYTDNEERNKLLTEACAYIYNNRYDSAKTCLQKALDISDDAYFQNILEKINSYLKSQQPGSETAEKSENKTDNRPVAAVKSTEDKPSDSGKQDNLIGKPAPGQTTIPVPAVAVEPKSGDSKTKPAGAETVTESGEKVPAAGTSKKEDQAGIKQETSATGITAKETKPDVSKISSGESEDKAFTAAELEDFKLKGKQKVADLERYIQKISNKKYSQAEAMNDINNALKLFDKEEHYVQVSSLYRTDKPKYLVRKYLEKVRALNYDNVKIEWAELQYSSKFRMAPDGNYYGFIKFRQLYTAMKGGEIAYQDVTNKVIAVILKPKQMAIEGNKKEMFEVFLGDIEVNQTFKR